MDELVVLVASQRTLQPLGPGETVLVSLRRSSAAQGSTRCVPSRYEAISYGPCMFPVQSGRNYSVAFAGCTELDERTMLIRRLGGVS